MKNNKKNSLRLGHYSFINVIKKQIYQKIYNKLFDICVYIYV
jgi:hypothetical protein